MTDDGITLTNQKDINAYLYDKIETLKSDGTGLEMRVAALEHEVQELPVIISDLEPLPAEDGIFGGTQAKIHFSCLFITTVNGL